MKNRVGRTPDVRAEVSGGLHIGGRVDRRAA
jgi:hypothetical protein